MRDTVFFRQAELLLRILPLIHKEEAFALAPGSRNRERNMVNGLDIVAY